MKRIAKWILGFVAAGIVLSVCTGSDNRTPEQKHEDHVSAMFSPVDGSHRALVKYTKSVLNDAESFEHVSTTYLDKAADSTLSVQMVFRAKNEFGAYVLKQVDAEIDYDGTVQRFTIEK